MVNIDIIPKLLTKNEIKLMKFNNNSNLKLVEFSWHVATAKCITVAWLWRHQQHLCNEWQSNKQIPITYRVLLLLLLSYRTYTTNFIINKLKYVYDEQATATTTNISAFYCYWL